MYDLEFLWRRESRKTILMIVTFVPILSIGKTAKIKMIYPDNIPSATRLVPDGPNISMPLRPNELQIFPGISEVKLTEEIFIGPDTIKFMKKNEFELI
ncbi:hypothetical protein TNCV_4571851 [Trichonephila clavipes]|nr:hypothetical protein TNCV_4571851 [Trichonephila clavipes]